MVSDFLNSAVFWEYDVSALDVDAWAPFIVKQVFNRNVLSQKAAIPSLIDYYGRERVEMLLRVRRQPKVDKRGENGKRQFVKLFHPNHLSNVQIC